MLFFLTEKKINTITIYDLSLNIELIILLKKEITMKKINTLTLFLCLFTIVSYAQVPSPELQIGAAVMAAPEASRDGAMVLGYNSDGKLVTLRQGTNEMICLADDPNRDGFSVACYHKALEPLMARGRELRAEGKGSKEILKIRGTEVKEGTLKMPAGPSTLYVLSGKNGKYDPVAGKVNDAFPRSVVYIPFATTETTGLSTKPTGPGMPWLMDAGTYRAHIMITPPRPKAGEKRVNKS